MALPIQQDRLQQLTGAVFPNLNRQIDDFVIVLDGIDLAELVVLVLFSTCSQIWSLLRLLTMGRQDIRVL